jgi:hypothetical protein
VVALRVRTVPNIAIAIQVPPLYRWKDVDARNKSGHDGGGVDGAGPLGNENVFRAIRAPNRTKTKTR